MKRYSKTVVLAAFLLANAGLAYGDAIIASNLTDTLNGTGTVYSSGPPQSYAQEFLTGNQNAILSSIIVPLGAATGSFTPFANLLADNGGLPGNTILTSFSVPTISTSSFTNLALTPSSSVILRANTNYWFALSATGSNGSYQWEYTDTVRPVVPNYAVSSDNGASWAIGTPPGPFLIQATATPEPSTLVLFSISLLVMVVVVRAHRFRKSE